MTGVSVPRPRGRGTIRFREARTAYLMILPWVIGLAAFNLGPIVATFALSFTRYDILSAPKFIGLDNYIHALTGDPLFWQSLANTAFFTAFSVPISLVLAFGLALLLAQKIRMASSFRTIIYLPAIVPSVAASVIFLWLFNSRIGIVNYGLEQIGLPAIPWLTDEAWTKPTLILISLWNVAASVVIFLAGLQTVPRELYEAADVDGASPLRKLRSITVPLMTPTILFVFVLGVINSFQAFTTAFVTTGGGPLNSSLFYMIHIYRSAFKDLEMGYASALSWVLFLIVVVLTALLFRVTGRRIYYEGG